MCLRIISNYVSMTTPWGQVHEAELEAAIEHEDYDTAAQLEGRGSLLAVPCLLVSS